MPRKHQRSWILAVLVFAALLVCAAVHADSSDEDRPTEPSSASGRLMAFVLGWTAWLSEVGVVVATVVQLPLWIIAGCTTGFTLLTLLSGFLFGAVSGVLSSWIGACVGSCVAFLAGRSFLRGRVTRWIHTRKDESLLAVHRALAANDTRLLLLVRLSPFFPFAPVSYLFSLSPALTLADFLMASSAGIFPRIFLTALAGSTIQSALHLLAAEHNNPYAFFTLVWGLAATIVLVIVITVIVRRALNKALNVEAKEISA